MEIKEYQERREEINKELRKLEDEYIKSKTDLKVGDTVKFVEQGDYYLDDSLFENYVKSYLERKRMEKTELRIKKLKRILDEKSYSIR
jgi:hypothetical protein